MKMLGHLPKLGPASARWLFEGVLIVASVLLAFAVDEYRETRANRELAVRVLNGLQTEIEHNLSTLERHLKLHRRWMGALNKWLQADGQSTEASSRATGLRASSLPGRTSIRTTSSPRSRCFVAVPGTRRFRPARCG
jgi:hypothetical protein